MLCISHAVVQKWLMGPVVSKAYTNSTHRSVVAWKAPSYMNRGLKTPHIMRCLRWRDAARTVTIICMVGGGGGGGGGKGRTFIDIWCMILQWTSLPQCTIQMVGLPLENGRSCIGGKQPGAEVGVAL